MNKIKATIYKGRKEQLTSDITIYRSLPNTRMNAIGSIVFLDHIAEKVNAPKTPEEPDGSFAHPHRGIATFTYILDGAVHHLDSAGGEGIVNSGGIQWMKAGNGIIHDEFMPYDFQESGGKFHGLQFWINLPAKHKAEQPDYMAIQSENIPVLQLPDNSGTVKVLLGDFNKEQSKVPNYLNQFMYHIKIAPGKSMSVTTNSQWEYGLYMVKGTVIIENEIEVSEKKIAELTDFNRTINFKNEGENTIDFMFFGGESYIEKMIPYGPFIMNSEREIAQAYNDYQKGEYGEIDYSKVKIE